jgi:mannose-6-phosphate isomerase
LQQNDARKDEVCNLEIKMNIIGEIYTRPWGTYQTLDIGEGYQVKLITVNPEGRLSLQKHFKRAEHWVVIRGQPTITVNDQIKVYSVNESIFIPKEAIHRLENFTSTLTAVIEVQIGDYLGEDDIIRLNDIYGRTAQ